MNRARSYLLSLDGIALFALASIAILTHWIWFVPDSIITFGDWYYWPDAAVVDLSNQWGPWVSFWGMGALNPQIFFYPFKLLWSIIVKAGGSYDLAIKVTFLWPIAIFGFWSPYWFARETGNRILTSCILALFYGSISYFLIKQTIHLTIAFISALAPLFLVLFRRYLLHFNYRRLLLLALFLSVLISYEIRVTFIVIFISLILVPLYSSSIMRGLTNMLMLGAACIALNTYWLIPVLFGGAVDAVSTIIERPLFGNHLFSLLHALPIHEATWTGGYPNMEFVPQIPDFYAFIPAVAVAFVMTRINISGVNKLYSNNAGVIIFSFIYLIGVFLTKQSSVPVQGFYAWAYANIPGFSLYREAGKFYLVSSLGVMGLLAYSLPLLPKISSAVVSCLLLIYSSVNLIPAATGELGTTFVNRTRPVAHEKIEELLRADNSFYRVLWVPSWSRWSYYDISRGNMSFSHQMQEKWRNLDMTMPSSDLLTKLVEMDSVEFESVLMRSSIKYIVVPPRDFESDDNFYRYYGGNRQHPEEWNTLLKKYNFLKPVLLNLSGAYVYEFIKYVPKAHSINPEGNYAPLIFANPYSGIFSVNIPENHLSFSHIRISEANDGRWQACKKGSMFQLLFLQCSEYVSIIGPLPNNQEILIRDPEAAIMGEDVWIRHKTVPYFWNGLLISLISLLASVSILIWDRSRINTISSYARCSLKILRSFGIKNRKPI